MLKLSFANYEAESQGKFVVDPQAPFIAWQPNVEVIKKEFGLYAKYQNYVVIGNGGSISTLEALWRALGASSAKKLTIVPTMEPDFLTLVKKENPLQDTLVIAISKSGDTVGVLEDILAFSEYPILAVTTQGKGTLRQLAAKMGWPVVEHPPVGGRFSGRSAVAYGPAYLLGLDVDAIERGAAAAIATYQKPDNTAWLVAQFILAMAAADRNEVYLPVYSYFLEGFNHLVTQLIHESTGKDEKGPTLLALSAPESQHHSNQRFFGGPKNMAGIFVTVLQPRQDISITVPEAVADLPLRDGKLAMLNGIKLHQSLLSEAQGTMTDAKEQGIPWAHLEIDQITPEAIGDYLVFWQFVAYYLAMLEGVDPFDQPQVERSKEISFSLRAKN
jgi:glucose-6-phosphate isomerase